jgi:hypothetical protein
MNNQLMMISDEDLDELRIEDSEDNSDDESIDASSSDNEDLQTTDEAPNCAIKMPLPTDTRGNSKNLGFQIIPIRI